VCVPIRSAADIIVVRQHGRALAAQAGFSASQLTIIATAISEVTRNIVDYATEGEMVLRLISEWGKQGVQIIATDRGPGIADIRTAMRDGYSSSARLGIGLPGVRRLMDEFEIISEVGKGTTVTMIKWVSRAPATAALASVDHRIGPRVHDEISHN
jgi:serine/threonine-protein kinase RsbT